QKTGTGTPRPWYRRKKGEAYEVNPWKNLAHQTKQSPKKQLRNVCCLAQTNKKAKFG
ncbi:44652_t:CDS:1, partial [Gigaspora margarita]